MMARLFAASLVVSLAVAGCGSSSSSSSAPAAAAASTSTASPSASAATPAAAAPLSLAETEYKLTPARATAPAGSVRITVRNAGSIPHALSIDNAGPAGQDAKTALLSPGASATITVILKKGRTYTWYCPVQGHRALGMQGTIAVAAAGGATAPAGVSTAGSAPPSSSRSSY